MMEPEEDEDTYDVVVGAVSAVVEDDDDEPIRRRRRRRQEQTIETSATTATFESVSRARDDGGGDDDVLGQDDDASDIDVRGTSATVHLSSPQQQSSTTTTSSLLDIHRTVVSRLFLHDKSNNNSNDDGVTTTLSLSSSSSIDVDVDVDVIQQQLQHRLQTLQRKRIYLQSELVRKRRQVTTVSKELLSHQQQQKLTITTNDDVTTRRTIDDDESVVTSVAEHRMGLRTKRRIGGSHRLAGISVLPCGNHNNNDPNVLGIRLDVGIVGGTYVHRWYVFFKLVWEEDEDRQLTDQREQQSHYYFTLIQHTLPHGVMSGLPSRTTTDASMDSLQRYIGTVHDVCYVYAMKENELEWLKKSAVQAQKKQQRQLATVTNVHHNTTMNFVAFQLQMAAHHDRRAVNTTTANNNMVVRVELTYGDPFSCLCTRASVSRIKEPTSSISPSLIDQVMDVVSDDDEEDEEDEAVLDTVQTAFETCTIREALRKVTQVAVVE